MWRKSLGRILSWHFKPYTWDEQQVDLKIHVEYFIKGKWGDFLQRCSRVCFCLFIFFTMEILTFIEGLKKINLKPIRKVRQIIWQYWDEILIIVGIYPLSCFFFFHLPLSLLCFVISNVGLFSVQKLKSFKQHKIKLMSINLYLLYKFRKLRSLNRNTANQVEKYKL